MKPQKFYSIGEAAKLADITIETLRHYDRIGLLKPAKVDSESRYRFYTDTELIYLEVISFCRKNKMPLAKIKSILNAELPEIISFLQSAETNIDFEIQRLAHAKEQIFSLRQSLQTYHIDDNPDIHTKFFEQRAILLAEQLYETNMESFRRLHNDIYQALEPTVKEQFSFDRSANFLIVPQLDGFKSMFAVCTHYCDYAALRFLDAGEYLCYNCTEKNKDEKIEKLWYAAKKILMKDPQYIVLNVQFIGLFQWQYEIQIPLLLESKANK